MNIKVSTFKSRLKHSPSFERETETFLQSIESALGCKLNYAELNDYDCDLKLIFVQTGGSEGLFLENFGKLQEPYYLLTNGSNNSLAASLEILTYLNARGKTGEILHGSAGYVAERISRLATVAAAKKRLKNARLGVIGEPSDWLIASVPDYGEVKQKLGVTIVDVPIAEAEIAAKNAENVRVCDGYPQFDGKELNKAAAIYSALDKIKDEYRLDGLTIRCFDLLPSLKSTGCLALAELNATGIIGTCEGDVAAMLSMLIVKAVTGQSSFQANPSRIDVENNRVTFAHCTVPLDMVDQFRFDTHFESGIGVAVKGELHTGRITVFRLSADLKRYFVSAGTLSANLNEADLCRTQAVIQLDKPVTELLKTPCGNHHVILYGDYAEAITQLMNELKIGK